MILAGKVVQWDLLLQVVYSALAAALAVTLAFSIAVAGATRFVEQRRSGTPARAVGWALLAALGLAVCLAGVVLGVVVMSTKS